MPSTDGTILNGLARSVRRLDDLEQETARHKQDCDDVTDNIFIAKKWLTDTFKMEKEAVCRAFNIPLELEYLD